MTRAELLSLFDQIVAILETDASPVEKLAQIEAAVFEPKAIDDESDADLETDEE